MNDIVQLPAFAAEGNNCTVGSPSNQHMITDDQLTLLENGDAGLAKDFTLLFAGGALGLATSGISSFKLILMHPERVKASDAFNIVIFTVCVVLTIFLAIAWFRSGSPKKALVAAIRGRPTAKIVYSD